MDPGSLDQHPATVGFLKQIQLDCHRARKELLELSTLFGERESAVRRQIRSALSRIEQTVDQPAQASGASVPQAARPEPSRHSSEPESEPRSVRSLDVCCLGRFRVRVGGSEVKRWSSRKARSLLKYIVGHGGGPVPKDVLMESLWPGLEPRHGNNNLKVTVCALRQTLSSACDADPGFVWVVFRDGSYMVNPEARLWTDAEEFERHWQAARRLESRGSSSEAVEELEAAEGVYGGDYLEDDLYEEWTWLKREALREKYLAILGKLADNAMDRSDHDRCIAYCQKILLKDPCREDAYRRLMQSHSRLGQRNAAIAWYRKCEKTIRAELNVPPDSATVGLHKRLLKNEQI